MMKRLLALALSFLAAPVFAQGDFVVRYKGLVAGRALLSDGFVTLYRSEHSYYLAIESSPSATESWTLRLPVDNGGSGECLKTNGSGVTSWATCYTLTGALLVANDLSDLNNTTTARSNLGVAIGSQVQAYHANLQAFSGLAGAADKCSYFTGSGTLGIFDCSSANRSAFSSLSGTNTGDQTTITGNAGTATALAANGTNCGVGEYARGVDASGNSENCTTVPADTGITQLTGGVTAGPGSGSQVATVVINANLTGPVTSVGNATTIAETELAALAGLNSEADKLPYFTGSGSAALADFSSANRSALAALSGTNTGDAPFSATVASGATYCADAGASDAYACNLSPAPASYAAIIGVPLTFKANTVNTGASTISFNSLGAQAIVKVGATTSTATVTNDIRAGSLVTVQWDGTNFQCLSCGGNGANLAIPQTWLEAQTFANSSGTRQTKMMGANGSMCGTADTICLRLDGAYGAELQSPWGGIMANGVGVGPNNGAGAAQYAIFPPMTLGLTSATMNVERPREYRTVVHSYTWTNAQVVALGATTTGDITVATLPAKTQVLDAMVVITGAAAGPATVTVSCGDAIGGAPFINYVVASDAKAAANTIYGDAVAERGTSIDTEFWYLPSYTATTLVTCRFISTGANLSTVTGSTGRVILTTRLLP